MKHLFIAILLTTLVGACRDAVAAVWIQYPEGKQVEIAAGRRDKITKLTIELLRSATYEVSLTVAQEQFDQARRQPLLYVRFTPAQRLPFRFGTDKSPTERASDIGELMVPFVTEVWPDYIFLREGGTLRAFSKYDPRVAQLWRDALKEI